MESSHTYTYFTGNFNIPFIYDSPFSTKLLLYHTPFLLLSSEARNNDCFPADQNGRIDILKYSMVIWKIEIIIGKKREKSHSIESYLTILHSPTEHDDTAAVILPDHPPHVHHCL